MKNKVRKLKMALRYGDVKRICTACGVTQPTVTSAFKRERNFSDLDIKIYEEASRIINERKNQIKNL